MGITEEMWSKKAKMDFGKEMDTEAKAWKTIWSAGQGVTSIEDSPSSKDLIDSLKEEFTLSINKQTEMLKKYS